MLTRETADREVQTYLKRLERQMDNFGSALPENKDRPLHQLSITKVLEEADILVYYYNSRAFAETGDHEHALVGNAPVIVDRMNGRLYSTGTARPVGHYLAEFRAGNRHPIEL
jgi:hypothetical protein